MGNLTKIIVAVGSVATAAALIAHFINKATYKHACNKWMTDTDKALNVCRKPLSDAEMDAQRLSSVTEIVSHYDDIIHDYFKDLLLAMESYTPTDEQATAEFITYHFNHMRDKLIAINTACKNSIRAELGLLSDFYYSNSQSKFDVIADRELICDNLLANRLGYLNEIENIYNSRLVDGFTMKPSGKAHFADLIDSFMYCY